MYCRHIARRNGQDIGGTCPQSRSLCLKPDSAGMFPRLHQYLAFTIEQTSLPRAFRTFVGLMTARIAIADPDDLSFSRQSEPDHIIGIGYFTPFLIQHTDI